jgi:putative endonuclease
MLQLSGNCGAAGEDFAASILRRKGYEILCRNYHSRYGEIDIIARNSEYLVFAEVKTRDENYQVSPLEAVTAGKQKKIYKTALLYLQSNPTPLQPRFDVIAIVMKPDRRTVGSAEHIENAFTRGGYY